MGHFPEDPSSPGSDNFIEKYKLSDIVIFVIFGVITLVNVSFSLYIVIEKYL